MRDEGLEHMCGMEFPTYAALAGHRRETQYMREGTSFECWLVMWRDIGDCVGPGQVPDLVINSGFQLA